MTRPLTYFLTYFILGIIFGQHYYENKYAVIFYILIALSCIILYVLKKTKVVLLFIVFTIMGIVLGINSVYPSEPDLYHFSEGNIKAEITGQIIDISKKYNNITGYIVNINNVICEDFNENFNSKALMYSPDELLPGDEVKIYGKIKNIPAKKNTTDFDSRSYYRSLHIEYKIYPDTLNKTNHITNFNSIIKSCRAIFAANFDRLLPTRESSFMKSIVLGDRSDLDSELYDTFKTGGVAHIVAISGLHISIITALIFKCLKKIHRNLAYIITILFLILYAVFSGMSPSVVRAVSMTLIMITGYFFGRNYDIISSAALVCIAMLIYNCYYIYNIGFCYSFICVFGIGMMIDLFRILKPNKIIKPILVSLAANISAKPLTIFSFYYFYSWDIISNIIIVPFMSTLIIVGIAANIISFICLPLAKIIILYDYYMIHFYEFVCKKVSSLPYYEISTGGITILTLISIYILIITIYNCIVNTKNIKYIALSILLFAIVFYNKTEDCTTYIDTEKSRTAVILKDNKCTLINCGSVPRANYGKYRIHNYLKYKNIKCIDEIYVTKTNYYYMGGIMEIYDDITINKIYILNNCDKTSNMYNKLVSMAGYENIDIEYIDKINIK